MWEKKKNTAKRNVILLLVIIVLAVIMTIGYLYVRQQQITQDEILYTNAKEFNANIGEGKLDNYSELEAEYQKDIDVLSEYLPGIVCWGDVLTQGTAGGLSYPNTLQKIIDERIVDQYNFKSTLENPYDYKRVDWDEYNKISIPVVNMGLGEENSYTILGRSGTMPFIVREELTIPAECEEVSVRLTNEGRTNLNPLKYGDGGINPVTINGVEGTLSLGDRLDPFSYGSENKYIFVRTEPGTETKVEKGTEIVTSASSQYKDYIHVVFIGSFGDFKDEKDLINQIKTLLSRQTQCTDRYIVIGPYQKEGYTDGFFNSMSALMSQEFGNRYINLRKYLMNDAMNDLGWKATSDDKKALENFKIPDSLLSDASSIELKGPVYELIGQLIYNRMETLGFFEEVEEELVIPAWVESDK